MNRCVYFAPPAAAERPLFKALRELLPGATVEQMHGGKLPEILAVPDIIFIDGYATKELLLLIEAIHQHAGLRHVPLVFTGKKYSTLATAAAYSHGASLYFQQPEAFPVLLMGLHQVLLRRWLFPRTPLAGLYRKAR